jgi:Kef-type K+ transport system membrane component KefB
MRRAAILLLLYLGMQLIIPLEASARGARSESLLVFGFLVLAAYTVGELARLVNLPKITGYLVAGLLFGPAVLGVMSTEVVGELGPVSRLAVALIAFLAGAELRWSELKERGRAVLLILGSELPLSFLLVFGTLVALQSFIPFFRGTAGGEAVVLAGLFASVAIVHSPAVTMALLSETGARGPVARTTLGVVLIVDVVVVLIFSGMLALARSVVPAPGATGSVSTVALAWEIGGSVLVGALLGVGVALYLRFVQRELMVFAVVVAFFGAEIARLAHVETLLTLLVAGFVTENASPRSDALLHAMERSAAPVFVVFFALAGASIHVDALAALWPLALAVVAARALGIFGGTRLGARWARAGAAERHYVWLGLVSQAGVAIGLASILADVYPERGEAMRTLLLAVISINEIAGQILFRLALVRSGEAAGAELAEPDAPAEVALAE